MNRLQDLEAPPLLVATPQVKDPFFSQSVVLLFGHDEEGSLGFVLNRQTELSIASILADLEVDWQGDPEAPVFVGGPVAPQAGTLLFPSAVLASCQDLAQHSQELAPGISSTQHFDDLKRIALEPPRQLRFVLGYAGWSSGQLFGEIQRSDWFIAPLSEELIFPTDSASAWSEALSAAGVQPDSLPDWFDSSEVAN